MSDSGVRVGEDRAATLFNKVGVSLRQLPVGEPLAPQLHEGDRSQNSVLVCWQVPAEIAGLLAVPGGQAPSCFIARSRTAPAAIWRVLFRRSSRCCRHWKSQGSLASHPGRCANLLFCRLRLRRWLAAAC